MSIHQWFRHHFTRPLIAAVTALLVAGCNSEFSVELSTANLEEASSLEIEITGVELLDEQDQIVRIDLEEPRRVDLMDYQGDARLQLLSDEEIPARSYRGIRVVFDDEEAELTREDGGTVPVQLNGSPRFAPLALSLSDDDSETAQAVLDLRFSLADRSLGSDVFLFRPELRAGLDGDLGSLVGTVDEDFVDSGACAGIDDGYAMYLFEGEERVPVDFLSGATGNPLASASVTRTLGESDYRYRFQGLPEGRYTLAFTCQADLDDPQERQTPSLIFLDGDNLRIEAGEETRRNF